MTDRPAAPGRIAHKILGGVFLIFLMSCAGHAAETARPTPGRAELSTLAATLEPVRFIPTSAPDQVIAVEHSTPPPTPTPSRTPLPPPPTPTARGTSTPLPTPTPVPTEAGSPTPTPSGRAWLAVVGDIMLDRKLGEVIERGRIEYPFGAMAGVLTPADLTIGNFESALGDTGEPVLDKIYTFRSPPAAAAALAAGGFDLVTLANNHALDYGPEALLQGIELLRQAGVEPIGAGRNRDEARRPYITEINGLRLAILAYVNVPVERDGFKTEIWEATADTPGVAWGRVAEVQADIAAVRPAVDHVIVLLHAGYEYLRHPSEEQIAIARGAIEAGATLFIGHHAHILQPVLRYKNGVIVLGLGNFAFNIDGDPGTAVLHVWLDREGVSEMRFIPAMIDPTGRPVPVGEEEGKTILEPLNWP